MQYAEWRIRTALCPVEREGKGGEKKVGGEMTRQADSSNIKAGQRKPGLETISKLLTRGTSGEDKSWSGNKDTCTHSHAYMHGLSHWTTVRRSQCVGCCDVCVCVCVCVNILEYWEKSKHTSGLLSLQPADELLAVQLCRHQEARRPAQMIKSCRNSGKQNDLCSITGRPPTCHQSQDQEVPPPPYQCV